MSLKHWSVVLSIAVVAALSLALSRGAGMPAPFSGWVMTVDADEAAAIESAIARAVRIMGEGCVEANRAALPSYQDQVGTVYSDSPPAGATLAARQAQWQLENATPDPSGVAESVQMAQTEVAAGEMPPDKATVIADYRDWVPTPEWYPEWSLADHRREELARCQAWLTDGTWRTLRFGVESVTYDPLRVRGDRATVVALIRSWKDAGGTFGGGSIERRETSDKVAFEVARERDGAWRITSETTIPNPLVCGYSGYQAIRDGMTAEQVRDLVGPPKKAHAMPSDLGIPPGRPPITEQWVFYFPEWSGRFVVYFGPDGLVVSHSCGRV